MLQPGSYLCDAMFLITVKKYLTLPCSIRNISLLILIFYAAFTSVYAKDKLEITGQVALSTRQNTSITLKLSDFTVSGPGAEEYPEGFSLEIFKGRDYSVSGTTVIPANGFTGTLSVEIRVFNRDTKSNKASITISVAPPQNVPPTISGQTAIKTPKGTTVKIDFKNLIVVDPDDQYPEGFTLNLSPGSNYALSGTTVSPEAGFVGTLIVPTTVNDGNSNSNSFGLKISVVDQSTGPAPESSLPYFVTFSTQPLRFPIGNEGVLLGSEIAIDDKDSPDLMYAEIVFDQNDFMPGKDVLLVNDEAEINEVFDYANGILVLFGKASLATYQKAIRSVRYIFNSDTLPSGLQKRIHFRLNDGENSSELKTKIVNLQEAVELDIPNVFSPNDDNANDQWEVRSSKTSDNLSVVLRVFDKHGLLIFETRQLDDFWDGKYNGRHVPPDTYFYTIELNTTGNRSKHQGIVTVLH
jgi:gliding motility-associated-like protein